jgi:hypothetical protein
MASLFGAMKDKCAQSRQAQQNGCDGLLLPKTLSVELAASDESEHDRRMIAIGLLFVRMLGGSCIPAPIGG